MFHISAQYHELVVIFAFILLWIGPQILKRWYVPTPVTALLLGLLLGPVTGIFVHDATIKILSVLGIVALFAFAGMEVEFDELRKQGSKIVQHILSFLVAIFFVAALLYMGFDLKPRASIIVSLALVTPSVGFILESLNQLGLGSHEQTWIRTKSISAEMVSLLILFMVLKSSSAFELISGLAVLIAMIVTVPFIFRWFNKHIAPYTPEGHFSFVLILSLICAFVTRKLGVYYLIGAFTVGALTRYVEEEIPEFRSEEMMSALRLFASFFIPFYFFGAGTELDLAHANGYSILYAIAFLVFVTPIRLGLIVAHRTWVLKESLNQARAIAIPMIPTLVFSLVLADILKARYHISASLYAGIVIYAIANTIIPSIIFRKNMFETFQLRRHQQKSLSSPAEVPLDQAKDRF